MARCSRSRWCRTSSSPASASRVLTSSTIRLSTFTASHRRDRAAGEHCAVPMTSRRRLNTSPLRLLYWYASSAPSSELMLIAERLEFPRPTRLLRPLLPRPPSRDPRRESSSLDGAFRGDDDFPSFPSSRSSPRSSLSEVVESMRSSRGFRSTPVPGLYTGREPNDVCLAPCTKSAALVPPRCELPREVDGSDAESGALKSALLPVRRRADAMGLASTLGSCLMAGDLARTYPSSSSSSSSYCAANISRAAAAAEDSGVGACTLGGAACACFSFSFAGSPSLFLVPLP